MPRAGGGEFGLGQEHDDLAAGDEQEPAAEHLLARVDAGHGGVDQRQVRLGQLGAGGVEGVAEPDPFGVADRPLDQLPVGQDQDALADQAGVLGDSANHVTRRMGSVRAARAARNRTVFPSRL
jgi:hypothetical protein